MLSIFTRIGDEGVFSVRDLLLCLAGQTDQNFEWLIIARPSFHSHIPELKRQLNINPDLQRRTIFLISNSNSRGGLLNLGLKKMRGDYFVVLDDDDLVSSNYVESFNFAGKKCKSKNIIRSVAARKIVEPSKQDGHNLISISKAEFPWPKDFSQIDHIYSNQTPCFSIAFPKGEIDKFKILWDETLSATEDWDFLLNASSKIKVLQIQEITGIYRVLANRSRSQRSEKIESWVTSEIRVRNKMKQLKFPFSIEEIEILAEAASKRLSQSRGSKGKQLIIHFFTTHINRNSRFYILARKIYRKFYSR
jgi:hypothetical protein